MSEVTALEFRNTDKFLPQLTRDYDGILPETASREEWAEMGRHIYRSADGLSWQLADWAAFGDRKWGALKAWCDMNTVPYETVKQYAWVARSVKRSNRLDQLSFSHHIEVAGVKARQQKKWLKMALDEQLSVSELRRRIREAGGDRSALLSDGPMLRTIGSKCDDLKSFLLGQPADFWTADVKAKWRERLKPLVEFYQTL